jgi:chorismate mutase
VIERLFVSGQVAAAKLGTSQHIADPAREQQQLTQVRQDARKRGIDPDAAVAFFQDQIIAGKIVQEGLFQRWIEHAEQAPTIRSDLGRIRHQLDGIATAIMQQLAAIQAFRHPPPFRPARRLETLVPVDALNHLDDLERRALTVALHSVCCPHSRRRLGNSGRRRGRLSLDGFPFPVRKI